MLTLRTHLHFDMVYKVFNTNVFLTTGHVESS